MNNQSVHKPHKNYRYLFVSDAHLGGFSDAKNLELENAFLKLIDFCKKEHLEMIILGDLFDYWMEVGSYIPKVGSRVCERFKELHEKTGKKTLFITGNHDNWTYGYLSDEIGFRIVNDSFQLPLQNGYALLYHGDGLPDENLNLVRPAFHRFLRNPYFTVLYKSILPGKLAVEIMRLFSKCSRMLSSDDDKLKRTLIDSKAKELLELEIADAILCGHHHKATFQTINNRIYMNTGNFYNDRNVGLYVDGQFSPAIWHETENLLVTE